jgi:hypothetical protein
MSQTSQTITRRQPCQKKEKQPKRTITVYFKPETHARLKECSKRFKATMSSLVNAFLAEGVCREEPSGPEFDHQATVVGEH